MGGGFWCYAWHVWSRSTGAHDESVEKAARAWIAGKNQAHLLVMGFASGTRAKAPNYEAASDLVLRERVVRLDQTGAHGQYYCIRPDIASVEGLTFKADSAVPDNVFPTSLSVSSSSRIVAHHELP